MSALGSLLEGRTLLIFDFDGTVADTSALHAAAFAQVLLPRGIAVDYSRIAGMTTADALRKCLVLAGQNASQAELEEMVAMKQRLARERIRESLQTLPGITEFLDWAQARYRMCLVSSGSRGTVSLALERLGLAETFAPCLCAEDVERAKPDPDGFNKALRLTETEPGKALVFEDSEAGFAAARAAGLAYFDARNNLWASLNGVAT